MAGKYEAFYRDMVIPHFKNEKSLDRIVLEKPDEIESLFLQWKNGGGAGDFGGFTSWWWKKYIEKPALGSGLFEYGEEFEEMYGEVTRRNPKTLAVPPIPEPPPKATARGEQAPDIEPPPLNQFMEELTQGNDPVLRPWTGGKYKCNSLETFIKEYQKKADNLTPQLITDYLLSERSGNPYTKGTIETNLKLHGPGRKAKSN